MSEFKDLQKEICEIKDEIKEEEEKLPPCEPEQKNEAALLEVEVDDPEEQDIEEVIYKADEIFVDFKELSKSLLKFTKFQNVHFLLNLKKLFFEERPYYTFRDSVKIKKFLTLLKPAIRKNFIRYKTKVKLKDVYEIKITFKKNKIKNISIRSSCCEFVKLKDIKLLKQTDSNIVVYLKYFKNNIQSLKMMSDKDNWLLFLLDISNNLIKEESLLPPSLESCIDMSAFDELEDKLLSESFSYGEFLQSILSEEVGGDNIAKTYKEDVVEKYQNQIKYEEELQNVKGSSNLVKKTKTKQVSRSAVVKNFTQNNESKDEVMIIKEITGVLEEADSLSDAEFGNITVRETFVKMASEALKNKLKFFSFEQVYEKMLRKVLGDMGPESFQKTFDLFSEEIKEQIYSEIRKRNPDIDLSIPVWELEDNKNNACDYTFEREQLVSTNKIDIDDLKDTYIDLMVQFAGVDFIEILSSEISELAFLKEILANKDEWIDKLPTTDLRSTVIPQIPEIPNFTSGGFDIILEKIKDILIEKAIDLVNAALLNMLISILESLQESLQDRLEGETDNKQNFKDFITDTICDIRGNSEETEKDLMRKVGVPSDLASNVADAIGNGFTSSQFNNAVINPGDIRNNGLYNTVIDSTRGTPLENFLTDIEDVKGIFFGISSFLTDDQLNSLQKLPDTGLVLSESICLTDKDREALKRITGKDDIANDKDNSDLDNILDSLFGTPLPNIANLISDALEEPEDPNCYDENNKLLEKIDEDIKELLDSSSDAVFEAINRSFQNDMIGKRTSFFDNLLADTRRVRLRSGIFSHDRRVALDLLFPNAADTIDQHSDKFENAGFFEKFLMKAFTEDTRVVDGEEEDIPKDEKPFPTNVFPETISIYCKEQVETAIDTIDYKITTDKYANGRKKEDLRLEFRNITKNEELEFDYGFNILYKDFLYNEDYKRNLDFQIVKIDINNTEEKKIKIIDTKITNSDSMDVYQEIINQIDNGEQINEPYRVYLFKKFLENKGGIKANKEVFELINKRISQVILQKLVDDEDETPEGYRFGFIDDRISHDDLIYVSPTSDKNDPLTWGYEHDEEEKILGKSATEHPRVKFLDPAKYGGRYTKPKVYIEETKMEGWLGLFSKVVPEVDGAFPKRENYLFLYDVAEDVKRLQTSIPNDKRFNVRPDCVQEPPFSKLMNSASKAAIEGVIRATIRTYVLEFILRTIPLLTQLKVDLKNNYHDILTDFVVVKMRESMEEQFSWPSQLKDSRYWYLFLDSSVDLVFRMIKEGRIEASEDLLLTMQEANEVSKNYINPTEFDRKLLFRVKNYTISNGLVTDVEYETLLKVNQEDKRKTIAIVNSMFYDAYGEEYRTVLSNKKDNSINWTTFFRSFLNLKYIKKITREYDIYTSENISKRVLSYLVGKEMSFYSEKLKESFGEPKIDNLNKALFDKKGILISDPVPLLAGSKNSLSDISISQESYDLAKQMGGFFIEYYYTFENKEKPVDLADGFEGIKSINEFKQYINQLPYKTAYLSNYFGNAKVVDGKIEGSIGVKFGVRLNYVPPTSITGTGDRLKLAAKINVDGNEVTYNESKHYFTIASYERDVVDKRFSEIDLDSNTLGESVDCYLEELAKEKEIKFFFDALLITKKIPALIGIYYYDGFIESLGLSDSERDEGFIGTKGSWKEKILKQTKEQLADMFKDNYFAKERRTFGNNFDLFRRSRERLRGNNMPNLRKNFDKSVKRKQLRREVSRPFDMFGNEHVSPLDGLLGD